jgi:hypothetical protein
MQKLLIILSMVLLSGCAVGNKYDYRTSAIDLPLKSAAVDKVVLSVNDMRPYVVEGKKAPTFVGLQRGGFGNPFDVNTVSGKPLADDMFSAIENSLDKAGYQVIGVEKSDDEKVLVTAAAANGAKRIVVLNINEWKSDVMMSVTLHCDLELTIYDQLGVELAKNRMKFDEGIGGAQMGAAKNSQIVTAEFAKRIGYLFNSEQIRSVL